MALILWSLDNVTEPYSEKSWHSTEATGENYRVRPQCSPQEAGVGVHHEQ